MRKGGEKQRELLGRVTIIGRIRKTSQMPKSIGKSQCSRIVSLFLLNALIALCLLLMIAYPKKTYEVVIF
jgi:hypothetical protein